MHPQWINKQLAVRFAAATAFTAALFTSACKQADEIPTIEAEVMAQIKTTPHAVAAIEISLARIAYEEAFGGSHPDLGMLAIMESPPPSTLKLNKIPSDQRALLQNVAKRLTAAHNQYSKEFELKKLPYSDFDSHQIIGNAASEAVGMDEPAARALLEIYEAWPALFVG